MPATSLSSTDTASTTTSQGSSASLAAGAPVSTQAAKISKGTIVLLAVIGAVVGGIFIGFFIYAKVKKYKSRGKRHPSRPRPSLSMSPMTQSAAGVSSTQSATLVDLNSRGAIDDRGGRRSMAASPIGHSRSASGGASGPPPSTVRGNVTREGPDDRTRRPEQQRREPQTRWAPPPRPPPRPSQPRRVSVNYDEPEFRFVAHPYQSRVPQESGTSLPVDAPLDLALPVNTGIDPPQSSTSLPAFDHPLDTQSSPTHVGKSEKTSAGSSRQGSSRAGLKPTSTNMLNATSLERKLSKSFLTFDDVETPSSSNPHLPALYQSPAMMYQSPALPSSTGHTPNPNPNPDPNANETPAASRFMTVIAPYKPLLSDELPLRVGDVAKLLADFDDGWCIVERNGTTGAVPKVCLRERPQP